MSPLSVLLVEDDAQFRDAFVREFSAVDDMRLSATCATGGEALRWLAQAAPDVLLADLGLPDVDGLEVIRDCARRHPGCEIMVITVFGDERHVMEALEAGATGYLLKEALPRDFLEPIRALRAGGSPLSPIIARRLLEKMVAPATPVVAARRRRMRPRCRCASCRRSNSSPRASTTTRSPACRRSRARPC